MIVNNTLIMLFMLCKIFAKQIEGTHRPEFALGLAYFDFTNFRATYHVYCRVIS